MSAARAIRTPQLSAQPWALRLTSYPDPAVIAVRMPSCAQAEAYGARVASDDQEVDR